MRYPQIITFRKILYGLLAFHLLAGAIMLYGAISLHSASVFWITVSIAISMFYLVLLITLINYVEYLEQRIGSLLDRIIHFENDSSLSTDTESRSSLSGRLGKL
jgi:hypothetical protein